MIEMIESCKRVANSVFQSGSKSSIAIRPSPVLARGVSFAVPAFQTLFCATALSLLLESAACGQSFLKRGIKVPVIQIPIDAHKALRDVPVEAVVEKKGIAVSVPNSSEPGENVKVNDPANLVMEANKLEGQLPTGVLAEAKRGGFDATSLGPPSVNEFKHRSDRMLDPQLKQRPDYKQVETAYNEAQAAYDRARGLFDAGDIPGFYNAREALRDQLLNTVILIETLYGNLRDKSDRTENDKTVSAHFIKFADSIRADLWELRALEGGLTRRATPVDKAIYGFDDNFEVFTLQRLYKNAPAVGLIRDKNTPSKAIGTVFLIGKNVVATAAHCVRDHRDKLSDLELVFFYEMGLKQDDETVVEEMTQVPCVVAAEVVNGDDVAPKGNFDFADFAVLKFHPPAAAMGSKATDRINAIKPLHLSLRPAVYPDALCGIGHPRGEKKQVHLNCRVLLPFELGDARRNSFVTQIARRIGVVRDIRKNTSRSSLSDAEIRLVKALYSPDPTGDGKTLLYADRKDGLARPAIGIEADTFPGDSGGPILDVKTNAVVGILVSGEPTSDNMIESVTIKQHEVALPIEFLIASLGNDKIQEFGIKILPRPQ
jgi:hypothetical protein